MSLFSHTITAHGEGRSFTRSNEAEFWSPDVNWGVGVSPFAEFDDVISFPGEKALDVILLFE